MAFWGEEEHWNERVFTQRVETRDMEVGTTRRPGIRKMAGVLTEGSDDDVRTYAAVPHEYYEEMAELTDEEFGRLIRALLRYSMTGEESALTGNERFFFKRVTNQEVRHQKHYDELSAVRSEAGRRGAAARWGTDGKMANDSNRGNNDTKNKTENKNKNNYNTHSRSSADERRFEERLQKDIMELERFMKEVHE